MRKTTAERYELGELRTDLDVCHISNEKCRQKLLGTKFGRIFLSLSLSLPNVVSNGCVRRQMVWSLEVEVRIWNKRKGMKRVCKCSTQRECLEKNITVIPVSGQQNSATAAQTKGSQCRKASTSNALKHHKWASLSSDSVSVHNSPVQTVAFTLYSWGNTQSWAASGKPQRLSSLSVEWRSHYYIV